ncbi:electron transfer flavoprotein subunit alpha/FixB family protein [Desulfotomaculum copahuensis]|uniref:electron transfer flavoprotein subunit alpha/FixB family protein n=1 Tax=Desulfotomaculum copahuensis TaxID=1838280 RepID=UPI000B015EC1|nr:electron transfer flavoprotein subunit alpha/FixB family protein [Desulfotomaculum copahuensis]
MAGHDGVMILAEQKNGRIHPVTHELLHRGRQLADALHTELSCVVIGAGRDDLQELIYRGADRVYLLNPGTMSFFLAGPVAGALTRLIREERPAVVVAAATTSGRTVVPLAAARLETGLTADCTELSIEPESKLLLQTRPAIGGNVMATIKTPFSRPQMATVRPHSMPPAPRDTSRHGEIIEKSYPILSGPEKFLGFIKDETQEVNLQEADVVVTGGRGMKSPAGFKLVEELAGVLGAGVGATRAVVELGWAPYSHQIGLSGKTVAPKVYIAAGVSGQIQHLAGMQTAEYIVAINEDPEAMIFKVADLGLVGDALQIVPRLTAEVKKLKEAR